MEHLQNANSPVYSNHGVQLHGGDCVKLLAHIPDGTINLTVTSPPYNIGKEYETLLDVSDYINWCRKWIGEIYRVTASNGAFWLNLGYFEIPERAKALPISYMLWEHIPFYIIQEIVWNYGAGVAGRRFFSPRNEKFLWCVKDQNNYTFNLDAVRDPNVKYPNQKKNGKLKCNPLGKNPSDVWQFPKVTSGTNRASKERTAHPAQFPTAVIDRIIRACSNPCELVLDPFMGSGSTAEACVMNNRRCIGFDISDKYLAIASRRLEQFVRRREAEKAQMAFSFGNS